MRTPKKSLSFSYSNMCLTILASLTRGIQMKALYINQHVSNVNDIKIDSIERPKPTINQDECLIKVVTSGINPSDALAVTGYFKHASTPRIPGRDFAGIVVEGPTEWVGKNVWGTGGAAGISFDGTQAEFIKLKCNELAETPSNHDAVTCGAQPLPYVTAYYSLVKRAHIQKNETVLVVGALGQVGSAGMSICQWKECNAIALVRGKDSVEKAKTLGWNALNSEDDNLSEKLLAANNGKSIDVILNSVGNIYWNDYMQVLSEFGRIVTIGARENVREVTVNLFNLYRANQDIMGVNTVSLDFADNAKLLNELKVGFEQNKLKPLAVDHSVLYTMENASDAYKAVLNGSENKRVVIQFNK